MLHKNTELLIYQASEVSEDRNVIFLAILMIFDTFRTISKVRYAYKSYILIDLYILKQGPFAAGL